MIELQMTNFFMLVFPKKENKVYFKKGKFLYTCFIPKDWSKISG